MASPRSQPSRAHGPRSTVVAMILVDARERRDEELRGYHEACRIFDREAKRLKQFEEDELPSFQRWVDAEFAAEVEELQRVSAAASALRRLLEDVETYAEWKGCSRRVALSVLEEAREQGFYAEIWAEVERAAEAEEAEAEHEADDDYFDRFRAEYEERRAREERRAGREGGRGGASRGTVDDAEDETAQAYLKVVYRRLVRALHPDFNADPSGEKRELWHEVQDAYEQGDLARLERILAGVAQDAGAPLNLRVAPIGDVMALRRAVEKSLMRARTKIRELQKHVAWGFRKTKGSAARLTKLRREIGRDLAHDLALVRMQHEELEEEIERLRKPSKARRRKR